jgi:hypothetical protein
MPDSMALNVANLRESLKSGPLSGAYAFIRRRKRRLLRQPVSGAVPLTFPPLSVEELFGCLPRMRGHSRFQYSLGLAYLERDLPCDRLRAAACLRSAEALGFESPERVAVHRARLVSKREAARLVAGIEPFELTPKERSLLEGMTTGTALTGEVLESNEGPWERARMQLEGAGVVSSLLAIGDANAATAFWSPDAMYLSATPDVTGVEIELVASLGLAFEVVVGPRAAVDEARRAGVCCRRWFPIETGPAAIAGAAPG